LLSWLSADMSRCEFICGGNGQPVCPTGSPCSAGFTVNPLATTLCAPCGGNLQVACATGMSCGAMLTSCMATSGSVTFNVCYDLTASEENCGMCGTRCMAGSDGGMASCVAGMCQ
jgi:hypothetical protein